MCPYWTLFISLPQGSYTQIFWSTQMLHIVISDTNCPTLHIVGKGFHTANSWELDISAPIWVILISELVKWLYTSSTGDIPLKWSWNQHFRLDSKIGLDYWLPRKTPPTPQICNSFTNWQYAIRTFRPFIPPTPIFRISLLKIGLFWLIQQPKSSNNLR